MKKGLLASALAAGCVAVTAVSQSVPEKAVKIKESAWAITYGADVRFRFDDFVHVPGKWDKVSVKDQAYTRTRMRGWMEAVYGDCKTAFDGSASAVFRSRYSVELSRCS